MAALTFYGRVFLSWKADKSVEVEVILVELEYPCSYILLLRCFIRA